MVFNKKKILTGILSGIFISNLFGISPAEARIPDESIEIAGIRFGSSESAVLNVFGQRDASSSHNINSVANGNNGSNAKEELGVSNGVDKSNNGISIVVMKDDSSNDRDNVPVGAEAIQYTDSVANGTAIKSKSSGKITTAVPKSSDLVTYKNGTVKVTYNAGKVSFITVSSPYFRTPDGLSVGDNSRKILAVLGYPDIENFSRSTHTGTYFYYGEGKNSLGMQIITKNGKIASISIGKFTVS